MRKITLRGLGKSGAANGQVPVWDDVNQVWVPADQTGSGGGSAVFHQADEPLSAIEGDLWVDSDDIGPGGGSGGGGGVLLLDAGASVPAGTPAGTIVFEKAAVPTVWDFKGLSALPAGWSRRGVTTETFDVDGMLTLYGQTQGYEIPIPGGVSDDFTFEAKMVSGTNSNIMQGVMIADSTGKGAATVWYSAPTNMIDASLLAWGYGNSFTNGGGSPQWPSVFRIRKSGDNFYSSFSIDDAVTWSSEVSIAVAGLSASILSFGSIYGPDANMKIEYAKFYPSGTQNTGKAKGWWDGSAIQPLG